MKLPWIKFFPNEYLRDTRPLSLAAKGAWMDILCALHSAQNRGEMTLPVLGWARVIGASVDQTVAVLDELSDMQVCDRVTDGNADVTDGNKMVTLRNRRMVTERNGKENTRKRVERYRDRKRAEERNAGCNAGSITDVTPALRHRSQKSEYRIQNIPPSIPPCRGEEQAAEPAIESPLASPQPACVADNAHSRHRRDTHPLPTQNMPVKRTLPPVLDTPLFREAWGRWLVHWAEAFGRGGRHMPIATEDEQLRKLAVLGSAPAAISAIENAVARGLREPAPPFANSAADADSKQKMKDSKWKF